MFQLIAGPCVIESEAQVLSIAGEMKRITDALGIPYTFKASFDKANRISAVIIVFIMRNMIGLAYTASLSWGAEPSG